MDFILGEGRGATTRATSRATVWREESQCDPRSARSVAAGDRTFRRRCRLNSPACCSRQARHYRHFTCRRRLPPAARSTFLGSRDCSGRRTAQRGTFGGGRQDADRQADNDFTCPHIGTGKIVNQLCVKMLSATARTWRMAHTWRAHGAHMVAHRCSGYPSRSLM